MHKALKVKEHPDIVFRLLRLEPRRERQARFAASACCRSQASNERSPSTSRPTARTRRSSCTGEVQLLMTDYGIKPPTAMLGMLKTDPKVTVTFETVLAIPTHVSDATKRFTTTAFTGRT